jgi:hypothetical protein
MEDRIVLLLLVIIAILLTMMYTAYQAYIKLISVIESLSQKADILYNKGANEAPALLQQLINAVVKPKA